MTSLPAIANLGDSCCGCGACAAACGSSCIVMVPDGAGFLRPCVDVVTCVRCGHCDSSCPSIRQLVSSADCLGAYWAQAASDALLESSSSGGVFGLLALQTLRDGGMVCGAAFGEGFATVHHICTEDEAGLEQVKCSKYVQSGIDCSVYETVRAGVKQGRPVLFSGTGCQVAGLRGYLGGLAQAENLLCIDVICHGVPSPRLWERYACFLGEQDSATLNSFCFRSKKSGWLTYSLAWSCDESGHAVPFFEDWYMKAFLRNASLRASCFSCPSKNNCGSDLTLGDYWGIERAHPEVDSNKGVSAVLVHTEKGREAFKVIRSGLVFGETTFGQIADANPSLTAPPVPHKNHVAFLRDVERGLSIEEMRRKWLFKPNVANRMKGLTRKLGFRRGARWLLSGGSAGK